MELAEKSKKAPVVKYYYDPTAENIYESSNTPDPQWIEVSDFEARRIINELKRGSSIYLNAQGRPSAFRSPSKPEVKWNETAELLPLSMKSGKPEQSWFIETMTKEQQLAKLADMRWNKIQNGEYRFFDDVAFSLSDQTMNTVTELATEAQIDPEGKFYWKVTSTDWRTYSGYEITTVFRAMRKARQRHFDIEFHYAAAVQAGQEVNANEWKLPTEEV